MATEKERARAELEQLHQIRESIDYLLMCRLEAYEKACRITASPYSMLKVKTTSFGDKTGNAAALAADMSAEITSLFCDYWDLMLKLHEKISLIADVDLRLILELRYLNFNQWNIIAKKLSFSEKHVFTLHNKALLAYAEIGRDNNIFPN